MTSVNTNAAALTALRTLQNTNSQLETTQSRISTGYKIGEAKDNAAYWAISTTLKSDNKSLSTVKDALGLGASTVDTAYQGLNKAKDVLDEIKSKLTAATQDGVNRDTIQQEIGQLQNQLKSIASSSVFSGENWLSVNSSIPSYDANKQVVASFSRDASGSVSIGTIKVDTSSVALYDGNAGSTAKGILDTGMSLQASNGRDLLIGGTKQEVGNAEKGGLGTVNAAGTVTTGTNLTSDADGAGPTTAAQKTVASSTAVTQTTGAIDITKLKIGDKVTFSVESKGTVYTITSEFAASASTGKFSTAAELVSDLNTQKPASIASVTGSATGIVFTSSTTDGDTLRIIDAKIADANGVARERTGWHTTGADVTSFSSAGAIKTADISFSEIGATDKLTFDLTVNGANLKVSVDAGSNGTADIDKLVANLNANADFAAKSYASKDGLKLVISSNLSLGTTSTIDLNSVTLTTAVGKIKETNNATGFAKVAASAAATSGAFTTAITLDSDDKLFFDIKLNSETSSKLVTIDKALVDKTLGGTTGIIGNIANYQKVVAAALAKAGVTAVDVAVGTGSDNTKLVFKTNSVAGTAASVALSNVEATKGANQMSIDKIDISADALAKAGATTSSQIKDVLTAYISVVNSAINKVTAAAASLGSVASRIDMQKSFVNTLMDTIDKGVGNLVDADMSEESTKLQALQVKQQLGVQALSIANQSAQSVLSLFRG